MSEQEQESPVWHAIVGDDWEPVLFGEMAGPHDEVLKAQGWVENCDGGGFIFQSGRMPRRRRKELYDVLATRAGVTHCCIEAAKPGDRFMLTQNGELCRLGWTND